MRFHETDLFLKQKQYFIFMVLGLIRIFPNEADEHAEDPQHELLDPNRVQTAHALVRKLRVRCLVKKKHEI
jgi:hypothetical protein